MANACCTVSAVSVERVVVEQYWRWYFEPLGVMYTVWLIGAVGWTAVAVGCGVAVAGALVAAGWVGWAVAVGGRVVAVAAAGTLVAVGRAGA